MALIVHPSGMRISLIMVTCSGQTSNPSPKSIRDVHVVDVVIGKLGFEHMVLERGQSTVTLSHENDFKKSKDNYHFHELEQYYTLKAEPEVVDDKTAEAKKLLKEAGYKIIKE